MKLVGILRDEGVNSRSKVTGLLVAYRTPLQEILNPPLRLSACMHPGRRGHTAVVSSKNYVTDAILHKINM
jgi:hypothetical protein